MCKLSQNEHQTVIMRGVDFSEKVLQIGRRLSDLREWLR